MTDFSDQFIRKVQQSFDAFPDVDYHDWCVDCGIDTVTAGEYYMVNNYVWSQTGIGTHGGMLCISCLEKRIGRILTSKDFIDIPINHTPLFRSDLLLERMSS